jgi:hypothetical protein
MRVLRVTLIAFALAVLSLIAAPASAETLGDARVGFSAERVLVINGQSYVGRMWHMPGEQRHEQDLPALKPIFILRADSAIGDIILPKLHTVVEFALPKELSLLGDPHLLRKPVGQETVNGIATTKYDVDEKTPQGRAVGSLWLSQEGIPMKCDATLATDKGKVSTIRWSSATSRSARRTPRCSRYRTITQGCRRRRPPHCSVCDWRDPPPGRRGEWPRVLTIRR